MLIKWLYGRLVSDEDGLYNAGHEYVDLGLSVYWATMNVGARYDYEYGKCCGWGGIRNGGRLPWSRYCTKFNPPCGSKPDYLTTLLLRDDIAHRSMGGDWRMPTVDEMGELWEKCSWQALMINHAMPAYRVTGLNGNSILLPTQSLWTSSLYANDCKAYCLQFWPGTGPEIGYIYRDEMLHVRGVLDKSKEVDEE